MTTHHHGPEDHESELRQLAGTLQRLRDACSVFVATAQGSWGADQSRDFIRKYGESSGELLRYNLGALPTVLRIAEQHADRQGIDPRTLSMIERARRLEAIIGSPTMKSESLNTIAIRLFDELSD